MDTFVNELITKQKQVLRYNVYKMLRNITSQEQNLCAKNLVTNIKLFSALKKVVVYRNIFNELCLEHLISYYQGNGAKIYQPLAHKSSKYMQLVPYNIANKAIFATDVNIFSIEQAWPALDILYIPLVAVDSLGYRLGRGGGYYDVLLSSLLKLSPRPIFCGVGYNIQLLDKLPVQKHDIRLDYFLSESQLVKFSSKA